MDHRIGLGKRDVILLWLLLGSRERLHGIPKVAGLRWQLDLLDRLFFAANFFEEHHDF